MSEQIKMVKPWTWSMRFRGWCIHVGRVLPGRHRAWFRMRSGLGWFVQAGAWWITWARHVYRVGPDPVLSEREAASLRFWMGVSDAWERGDFKPRAMSAEVHRG